MNKQLIIDRLNGKPSEVIHPVSGPSLYIRRAPIGWRAGVMIQVKGAESLLLNQAMAERLSALLLVAVSDD